MGKYLGVRGYNVSTVGLDRRKYADTSEIKIRLAGNKWN